MNWHEKCMHTYIYIVINWYIYIDCMPLCKNFEQIRKIARPKKKRLYCRNFVQSFWINIAI